VRDRRRPTPRERSSFLTFYYSMEAEGLGEGQEEANTQGEVVIPVILFSAWRRRGIGWEERGGRHPGRGRHYCFLAMRRMGDGQKYVNNQGEVVITVISFLAQRWRGIEWGAGGGQHPGRGHHSCHFIFSTEAERGLGKGRRRPTPRERSSFLSFYF
jgi:hypothetical protein